MVKKIAVFFDKLEDRVRGALSRRPIVYALVGAVGIILIWKGVWETAELFPVLFGPGSIILGIGIALITGLLVSFFVGDSIILSGYKHEKKLAEKTEKEIEQEAGELAVIENELQDIKEELDTIKDTGSGGAHHHEQRDPSQKKLL